MPTYDYECSGCHHRFELFESVHAEGSRPCPKCGKRRARRLPGVGAGVVFKGSGFYTTDYGRGSSSSPARTEKKSEEKGSKEASSGESKKEEKKETPKKKK